MTPTRRKNKTLKLSEIAKLIDGELVGDGQLLITGVSGIQEAQEGDITFLADDRYLPFLRQTKASAVVVASDVQVPDKVLIRCFSPSLAFAKIVSHFMPPENEGVVGGIHPTAVLGKDVKLGEGVSIGPFAVIEDGVELGGKTVIGAQCFLGRRSRLGNGCRLYPQVTIREDVEIGQRVIIHSGTVIGSDGFGYETIESKHLKIPQLGSVTVEDDVEIGSNVCVDRGRFRNTRIERGAKIDNLVQIAHNVVIGEDCLIISQVGISGSTQLGKNVIIAGQAGIVGHVEIGDEAIICARAGVSKSVPAKSVMLGEPARPIQEQKRLFALISRLPDMFKDLSELKKKDT